MGKRKLTDKEKFKITMEYARLGNRWTEIGRKIGFSESTIRSFIKKAQKGQFQGQMGRPKAITEEVKAAIINFVAENCETTLCSLHQKFGPARSTIRSILNQEKIHHFPKTPICNLTDVHKQNRVNFCRIFSNMEYYQLPAIIFTDESSVYVDPGRIGIWRKRGFHPENSLYIKEQYPLRVMVWSAIGPGGFKTKLLKVNGRLNSVKYIDLVQSNGIIQEIENRFGKMYIWQQDNAPSHRSKYTKENFLSQFPQVLPWPPKSPDLSPIEHLWDYLKDKIGNETFDNVDQLFSRLEQEWSNIPPSVIHNAYSSFLARVRVCQKYNGLPLATRWKEVHEEHNLYRKNLMLMPILKSPNS